jgi:hypothetical protein
MPLYDIKCAASGEVFERHIPLAFYNDPIRCACGAPASRVIGPVQIAVSPVDYSYDCPITGAHITSKTAHQENLKRQGCRVLETGEKNFNEKRRLEAEAKTEQAIDQTIEKAIDQMPTEKREQLARELSMGTDISVERV